VRCSCASPILLTLPRWTIFVAVAYLHLTTTFDSFSSRRFSDANGWHREGHVPISARKRVCRGRPRDGRYRRPHHRASHPPNAITHHSRRTVMICRCNRSRNDTVVSRLRIHVLPAGATWIPSLGDGMADANVEACSLVGTFFPA
jgi:hypothetical protein